MKIGRYTLAHPVLLAAGMAKTLADVDRALVYGPAAVTVGSYTTRPRAGNAGLTFWYGDGYSVNNLGLPNEGTTWLEAHLPEMVQHCHAAGVPLICSVAGFTPAEYGELALVAVLGGADMVELNLSCPNVWGEAGQHRIACFDGSVVAAILTAVTAAVGTARPLAVKLSPYSDPQQLAEIDQVVAGFPAVAVVVACNTFANSVAVTPGGVQTVRGGMAGPAIRAIALGQVAQHRAALPERIGITGVGGVSCGQDVRDLRAAGAEAVGVATVYWVTPRSLARIIAEYQEGTV